MTARQDPVPDGHDGSLLRSIIETAPDAIVTIDSAGRVLSFSPAAERMFGYAEAEIVGRNVAVLMPEPFHDAHDRYLARYLETGEKHIIGIGRDVRALRRNGEEFYAELAVGELASGAQKIFTGFIRDVTDRVEAQRRATRLQRSLDQLSRAQMLGEMSSALAHELNQPLAAVSNFARAARRLLAPERRDLDKAQGHLDRVAEQAQRAGEIIRRMRRLIERGQADLSPGDIGEIIGEAVRTHLGVADVNTSIVLDIADDLPQVLADRVEIQQVVLNLIRNAQEAMMIPDDDDRAVPATPRDGQGTVSVRAARFDPGYLVISVGDSGPGVPDELAGRLFEPFVTGKPTGIGVGLAVCRSIVQAHGGQIWAENRDGDGADFHFTLPVATP